LKLLVTGAAGFIGRALCAALAGDHELVASLWTSAEAARCHPGARPVLVGELGPSTEWSPYMKGIDVVVHLAGRAHVLHETEPDPAASFHRVNTMGTERVASQAAERGVRRFVFISSVGVHGRNSNGRPLQESFPPAPAEPYALSKWNAEKSLHRISAETGMEIVIVRPPLVYGPGVPGNFRSLLRASRRGIPLPLGSARAPRSLVGVENLASLLRLCIESPAAPGQTFLISDGEDICVADLCRRLASDMNVPSRLFSVPRSAFWLAARVAGRMRTYDQLFRPLTVDPSKARTLLGWSPQRSSADGLAATARWFASTQG
jgi:nucleoside-diphosphate-sugar epimerase